MRDMYKLSGKSIHVLRNLAGLKSACECVYDGTVYPNLNVCMMARFIQT
jgi:hypothetical protein